MEEPTTTPTPEQMQSTALKKPVGRLTFASRIYHQAGSESAAEADQRPGFTRHFYSEETQPYRRQLKVAQEWMKLDTGWHPDPSMIWLANDEGKGLTNVKGIEGRIIEVSFRGDGIADLVIPPNAPHGEWIQFEPVDVSRIRIRCREGTAKYTIVAYPR